MMTVKLLHKQVEEILTGASDQDKFYPHEVTIEPIEKDFSGRWVFVQADDEKIKITASFSKDSLGSGDFAVFNSLAGEVHIKGKIIIGSPDFANGEDPVGVWTDENELERTLISYIRATLGLE